MRTGRTIVRFQDLGWQDHLFVGHYRQVRASPGLSEHAHCGMFELCWLASGVQVYAVGGHRHVLRGGDCFVTRPDEVHSSAGTPQERGTLYWMIVRPPAPGQAFLGLESYLVTGLFARLATLPRRAFPGPPGIEEGFTAILTAAASAPPGERAVRIVCEVMGVLRRFADGALAPPSGLRAGGDLERVLARIEGGLHRSLPLAELADIAGLSLPRFKVVFRAALGQPPAEYVVRRRLDGALRAIRAGASVLDTALDFGFASSQHLATVCRRYTGRTPGSHRGE